MLHGWGEGPSALVTPVKAIRVGVGIIKNLNVIFKRLRKEVSLNIPILVGYLNLSVM